MSVLCLDTTTELTELSCPVAGCMFLGAAMSLVSMIWLAPSELLSVPEGDINIDKAFARAECRSSTAADEEEVEEWKRKFASFKAVLKSSL